MKNCKRNVGTVKKVFCKVSFGLLEVLDCLAIFDSLRHLT